MAQVATHSGKGIIWNRVKGTLGNPEPAYLQWGTGVVTGSNARDVNLFIPASEARVLGTTSLMTTTALALADTYQVVGTIIAGGTKTITELGLFDVVTASPVPTVAVSLTNVATTLSISSSSGMPTSGNYYAQLENEIVLVTGAAATSLTMARAQLGSTGAVHSVGANVTPGGDGGASAGGATSSQTVTFANMASAGGNMLMHADFTGIPVNSTDSIAFTVRIQLT